MVCCGHGDMYNIIRNTMIQDRVALFGVPVPQAPEENLTYEAV